MKLLNFYKVLSFLLMLFFFINCEPKKEECFETIVRQYVVGGSGNHTYLQGIEEQVPCGSVEQVIEASFLEGFKYEIINFKYTPDTGNNTTRLQFEIKLINPKDYAVRGFPSFTIRRDEIEITSDYRDLLITSCETIEANSSCIVKLDVEESRDYGFSNSVELVGVQYILIKE